jgi:signal transduction histidine kinase
MEVQLEHSVEDVKRLQRCINDLVGVLTLPAIWSGGEPSQIVRTVLDVLRGMLHLDLVYARLKGANGNAPIEMVRVAQSRKLTAQPQEIGRVLTHWLGDDPQKWAPRIGNPFGDGDISIVPLRLGLRDEIGVIVAGSPRADFPGQTEKLLLSVAANQAAIGLQEARLLSEQKRVANELDQQVAQRTRELAMANDALKKEIAEHRLAEERLRREERERRLSEEALGRARSELAHVARVTSLGALTASIAHEVNQPLSGIVTNASTCLRMLAADPPNVEGARETARRTLRDGNRASDVITRLRALFGKKSVTSESVDLNEATREVIALSLSELQRNRVILRTELADDLPPVAGDRVQLQQVILNLFLNASDAMSGVDDRPRQLVIRTERQEDNRVRLSVQDTGVGVEPQAQDRLFEAFYTTKSGGMGIGLSVSRSIIDSHQGRLWAAPNDGPGTTFSFSIPHGSVSAADADGLGAIVAPAAADAQHATALRVS